MPLKGIALSQNRIQYLDTLRVTACIFVLLLHSTIPFYDEYSKSLGLTILILITNVSSKLFFMISGALLLPVKRSDKDFITHRLKVILPPLLIWSAVYAIEMIFFTETPAGIIKRKMLSILFTPMEGVLWFLYAMVGLYLFMPILSKCLQALTKRQIEFALLLWMLSSLLPYANGIFIAPDSLHNMFSSFANFLGYVVLGYYLHNYPLPVSDKKFCIKFIMVCLSLAILLPIATFLLSAKYLDYYGILKMTTHDISINTIFIGIAIFTAIQRFYATKSRASSFDTLFSKLSILTFGIYLCHMLIYRHIVWTIIDMFPQIPVVITTLLLSIVCLAISALIIRIIYLLPFSKYIIGH